MQLMSVQVYELMCQHFGHEKFWFKNWEWKDFTAMVIDDGYSSGIGLGGKVFTMN